MLCEIGEDAEQDVGDEFIFRVEVLLGVALESDTVAVELLEVVDGHSDSFAGEAIQRPEENQVEGSSGRVLEELSE